MFSENNWIILNQGLPLKSDRSSSLEIVKARKGRKCRDGKGRGNDSRSEFLVELAIDLATTTPRSPLAFFVKQVEIDVMLMEFREISANHMLSCAAAAEKQPCGKRNLILLGHTGHPDLPTTVSVKLTIPRLRLR
ncbi:uncharacterized protein [Mycetomoellerius zeteki]|uniref:uncharacterized protein isoform X1 n=1 Tax=Mycetomoellerius zeteki TaxID=64791 RepID=UPI00084E8332|nr:PREDICTED: uncharacterized protein LOC108721874 isoform X1 [Trachymyrmex zeteki]